MDTFDPAPKMLTRGADSGARGEGRKQPLLDALRQRARSIREQMPPTVPSGVDAVRPIAGARSKEKRRVIDLLRQRTSHAAPTPWFHQRDVPRREAGGSGASSGPTAPRRPGLAEGSKASHGRVIDILRERAAARSKAAGYPGRGEQQGG